ncbi:hypothetical protein [Flammeovirga pacifica]|uniref:Uncharacterized protein n=1 Tax=Flammeovirga pacifica TaxID=915059 RepID=A0A1S1YV16_FLAPC|nr:hypothetical protein [Flammeovirga pacifica]OHX64859.1 hypothetical protein NH26_00130 [Flammeovirga pacifica]
MNKITAYYILLAIAVLGLIVISYSLVPNLPLSKEAVLILQAILITVCFTLPFKIYNDAHNTDQSESTDL